MFRPLALYIGLRYTRAKRHNRFVSFISLTSMLGIALGVAVLITVLSVMNGFDIHIRERVFSLAPEVTLTSYNGGLSNWKQMQRQVATVSPQIITSAPFVQGQGLLRFHNTVKPAIIYGIVPTQEAKINELHEKMFAGSLNDIKPGEFGIVLGNSLAFSLGITLGDKITVITPQLSISPAGIEPIFKVFTVVGVFSTEGGLGFNSSFVYISQNDAQALFNMGESVSGLHIKLKNLYNAPQISNQLMRNIPNTQVTNWTNQFGAFFQAIQLEKTIMFLILLLIIAVAAFNLVSTLVMLVTDKKADIAILRTLGATPRTIMGVFIIQGAIVGIIGTTLGLLGGVLLSLNVSSIVSWLERIFHRQFISSSVYYLNYLPSNLELHDVVHICLVALSLSLLATLYPAWKASRVEPVEALRYE